jgi:thioredoxin reductase
VAELTTGERPFPPGRYPVVIVGSGPGAMQLSYSLRALGVKHAVISQDPLPGGMFRRWPIFQRMLSWTKPFAEEPVGSRRYERFDWNSLLGEDESTRAIMPTVMDGTSYFPSRPEMELGLLTFAERARLEIRHNCTWESTRAEGGAFVLGTSDGEYRTEVAVFAVGIAEPWRPAILQLEGVQQYSDLRPAEKYAGKRVFIVGKQNSGFEIATALLPWARQIVLASPSPTKLSVQVRSLVGVRARYVQPYEDWALAGGVVILDASIESVERTGSGFRVKTRGTEAGSDRTFDVDEVIAATGFVSPLRDLASLGVAIVGASHLPLQTPYWESTTVPGIFFAGTIMQGSHGLRKHGIPGNSGAVQGYRYNARVLARHIATKLGVEMEQPKMRLEDVVPYLLDEVSHGPELWHQRSYLASAVVIEDGEPVNAGIQPLAHFIDHGPANGIAITLESNGKDDPYPAAYVRAKGVTKEHLLQPPDVLLDFEGPEYRRQLSEALSPVLGARVAPGAS